MDKIVKKNTCDAYNSFVPRFKVLVIGAPLVGKTALTLQFFQQGCLENHDPTIEATYYTHYYANDEVNYLEVQDTAGEEEFGSMVQSYYQGADGYILVMSIVCRDSLYVIRDLHNRILKVLDVESFPMLLVVNKIDLKSSRKVSDYEIYKMADELGLQVIQTSAKSPTVNINNAFSEIIKIIKHYQKAKAEKSAAKQRKKIRWCCFK